MVTVYRHSCSGHC